ncbi:hypothetical protein IB286_00710 [Spongiibacter sp. KMU-158]|uniref:Uncharacterized protein n=1 Tax=Spongiibacter pelagi TaxID=2760804 RepID=A0A927GV47_9GAMM|nr:hypothetical protein [Spongiibacter pelagi]MBD2857507.1 hypothetical protein [Spongiibacter pelagi]
MYLLTALDTPLLTSTKKVWESYLQDDDLPFSPTGYEGLLSLCESTLANPQAHRDTLLFAVHRRDETFATAIFLVTIPLAGTQHAWMKILESRTSPALDSRWTNSPIPITDRLRKIAQVLVTGFFELYRESITTYQCSKLKIFGNKQADRALFMKFVEHLDNAPETEEDIGQGLEISLESYGAWMELSTRPIH